MNNVNTSEINKEQLLEEVLAASDPDKVCEEYERKFNVYIRDAEAANEAIDWALECAFDGHDELLEWEWEEMKLKNSSPLDHFCELFYMESADGWFCWTDDELSEQAYEFVQIVADAYAKEHEEVE